MFKTTSVDIPKIKNSIATCILGRLDYVGSITIDPWLFRFDSRLGTTLVELLVVFCLGD